MTDPQRPLTKKDLDSFEDRINNNFKTFAKQIIETIDSFRDEFRSEILTLKSELKAINERLTNLEKRTIEDSNVFASAITEMKEEIDSLTKRVQNLEAQKA
jgi:polyhydroxyalkanoate synthesis regulator phasin